MEVFPDSIEDDVDPGENDVPSSDQKEVSNTSLSSEDMSEGEKH